MQEYCELQGQVNICLQDLDKQLEKSSIKIDDAITSFEELLRLLPKQIIQQQIQEQAPKTYTFKVKLKLEDIIIHEVNEIQHKKLQALAQQVIEEEQEIVQKYVRKEDLYEVLNQINNINNESLLNEILERLQKDKITDSLEYFSNNTNKQQSKLRFINDILKNISELDFNKKNFSIKGEEQIRKKLIKKISQDWHIIEFLKFLVRLTAIDERFIQCGSNSLNLLVEMRVDLREQSFENIRIRDTSLVGGQFVRCNFTGSSFDNVDISGINLNQAKLFYCIWKNINLFVKEKLDGHTGCVSSVCFSPDGTKLASGSVDKSIRLWDAKTGQQQAKLDGHNRCVRSVCFSPDSTTLASASYDNSIRLWDVKTGQQKAKLDGHTDNVCSVCYSPDGTTLASGSSDNSIRFWNVETQQQKDKLDGHSNCVNSICFSPDGTGLASGSDDQSIRLWNVETGQQKAKLDGHSCYIRSVCYSPDGTTLASCSYCDIRLWDVKTGQQKFILDGHKQYVNSICFSPDSTRLASGSDDQSIRLWDVEMGQKKAKLGSQSSQFSCLSPDGTSIRLQDVKPGQYKAIFDSDYYWVCLICVSSDGTLLASCNEENSIRLWDVKTGEQIAKLDGHTDQVSSICFSPDCITLASISNGQPIRLWDVKTAKEILPQDNFYKVLLSQFTMPLQSPSILLNSIFFYYSFANIDRTILQICQSPNIIVKGALMLKGELGEIREYFRMWGSCNLQS